MGFKILRSIYMDRELLTKIKKLSEKTKMPQAVYIREALDLLLQKYDDQLNGQWLPIPVRLVSVLRHVF